MSLKNDSSIMSVESAELDKEKAELINRLMETERTLVLVASQKEDLEKQFSQEKQTLLHSRAKEELESITEYIRVTTGKLSRNVEDLDSLGFIMHVIKEVHEKECSIDMDIEPIMDMYRMLENLLPLGFMEKEENDKKTVLRSNWRQLVLQALARTEELLSTQFKFKKGLVKDIIAFKADVQSFYTVFTKNGPLVKGLAPMEAVDQLSCFREEATIRQRKFDLYYGGEDLFALPHEEYSGFDRVKKDINLASLLFDLYVDVIRSINKWKLMAWDSVARLRDYESFTALRKEIEDTQIVLPLIAELSKDFIKARHWDEVMQICNTKFDVVGNPDFKLQPLLESNLVSVSEQIEEVTDGVKKQQKIENQLGEIKNLWKKKEFMFAPWKDRGVYILKATPKELEEDQMNIQMLLTMRHVAPFRNMTQELDVFDAVQYVEHDKKDKTIVHKIQGAGGVGHEVIPFIKPVNAVGNIEVRLPGCSSDKTKNVFDDFATRYEEEKGMEKDEDEDEEEKDYESKMSGLSFYPFTKTSVGINGARPKGCSDKMEQDNVRQETHVSTNLRYNRMQI